MSSLLVQYPVGQDELHLTVVLLLPFVHFGGFGPSEPVQAPDGHFYSQVKNLAVAVPLTLELQEIASEVRLQEPDGQVPQNF
jgi:hypothetical protein